MKVKFIEAVEKTRTNWGKFMVAQFDTEWEYKSALDGQNFLSTRGWMPENILVFDMQTGEGAIFNPNGVATIDLNNKHQIWVCLLYEAFLTWLYKQDLSDISKLPALIDLGETTTGLYGYRRNRGGTPEAQELEFKHDIED